MSFHKSLLYFCWIVLFTELLCSTGYAQSGVATYRLEKDFSDLNNKSDLLKAAIEQALAKQKVESYRVFYNGKAHVKSKTGDKISTSDFSYQVMGKPWFRNSQVYVEGRYDFIRPTSTRKLKEFTGKMKIIAGMKCQEITYYKPGSVGTAYVTDQLPEAAGWYDIEGTSLAAVEFIAEKEHIVLTAWKNQPNTEVNKFVTERLKVKAGDLRTIKFIDSAEDKKATVAALKKYDKVVQYFWFGDLTWMFAKGQNWKEVDQEYIKQLTLYAKKHPSVLVQIINVSDEEYFVTPLTSSLSNLKKLRGGRKLLETKKAWGTPILVFFNKDGSERKEDVGNLENLVTILNGGTSTLPFKF